MTKKEMLALLGQAQKEGLSFEDVVKKLESETRERNFSEVEVSITEAMEGLKEGIYRVSDNKIMFAPLVKEKTNKEGEKIKTHAILYYRTEKEEMEEKEEDAA